jgi:hypothetical protein
MLNYNYRVLHLYNTDGDFDNGMNMNMGISIRLSGGRNSSCLTIPIKWEGWSDWFALIAN